MEVQFTIFIKVEGSGKTFPLDVFPSDEVQSLKAKIQEKEGFPADQQQLYLPQNQNNAA